MIANTMYGMNNKKSEEKLDLGCLCSCMAATTTTTTTSTGSAAMDKLIELGHPFHKFLAVIT
jgi:hypothetical protein